MDWLRVILSRLAKFRELLSGLAESKSFLGLELADQLIGDFINEVFSHYYV